MLFHWQCWAQDQAFLVGIILPLWTQCFCTTSPRPHGRSLGVFLTSPAGLCGTATGHFPSKFEVVCWALLVAWLATLLITGNLLYSPEGSLSASKCCHTWHLHTVGHCRMKDTFYWYSLELLGIIHLVISLLVDNISRMDSC